jgi:chromosome segregation ATPase
MISCEQPGCLQPTLYRKGCAVLQVAERKLADAQETAAQREHDAAAATLALAGQLNAQEQGKIEKCQAILQSADKQLQAAASSLVSCKQKQESVEASLERVSRAQDTSQLAVRVKEAEAELKQLQEKAEGLQVLPLACLPVRRSQYIMVVLLQQCKLKQDCIINVA